MGKLYTFVYKCRYCGEIFREAHTGKAMGVACLLQTAYDLPRDRQHPEDRSIHFTDDHAGLADLIGCEIEGN